MVLAPPGRGCIRRQGSAYSPGRSLSRKKPLVRGGGVGVAALARSCPRLHARGPQPRDAGGAAPAAGHFFFGISALILWHLSQHSISFLSACRASPGMTCSSYLSPKLKVPLGGFTT